MRNFGVEPALRVASYAAERPHPYIVGFSMAGDEENYPPAAYAEAFEIAAGAGLGCTVHAGEWAGPESVRGGLELPVTRIAHGVRSIEDPALVEELAERGTFLECCPTSNVVLGIYPSYEEHPLPRLMAAGREGHARIRRPALLRGVDRRRVRDLPRALRLHGRRPHGHNAHGDRGRILRRNAQRAVNGKRCRVAQTLTQ